MLPRRALCSALPYHDRTTGASMLAAMRECSAVLPRIPQPPLTNIVDPDRPLVVGLLSGSFKSHPVGWLTVAGIETLDPDQFSVICLAQATLPTDAMCQRFRAVAREWVETECMTDAALVDAARTRGIDILIDLGGYGDAGRMTACANRLAPVQIKWVGMQCHSSGLAEMDWFLTDRWETPDGFEPFYSEKLLRLPDGYVCYSPPPYAPDVVPLPALKNGFVTFGCFNNLAKITPSCDRDLGGDPAARPDRAADPEDPPVVRPSHRRRFPRRLRRGRYRRRPDRIARFLRSSRLHGPVWRRRYRARPVSLFRRPDDLRGAVDGRAHHYVAGRDFRLPPFRQPHEQCRACRTG